MGLLDTNITLSVPYNHDASYAEWLDANAAGISEVYLPVHASVAGTGRGWRGPVEPGDYRRELRGLASVCGAHGVGVNIVVNGRVPRDLRGALHAELAAMRDVFGGTACVTVVDFSVALRIRREFPDLEIGTSTLADIRNVQQARYWLDRVGVGFIVPGRDINRKPDILAAIRALGVRVKVVVDDMCVPGCPAMWAHLNVYEDGEANAGRWCAMAGERRREPWTVAQKDIVPAALPRYEEIIDVAKLQGRSHSLDKLDQVVQQYLAAESWEHPYIPYTEPPAAQDMIANCDRDCGRCGWCARHFSYDHDKDLGHCDDVH